MNRTVAVVSTGAIGASWAAHFLAEGWAVRAVDPAPGAEAALRAQIEECRPALRALGRPHADGGGTLVWCDSIADAVAGAQLVQENGPERVDVKRAIFAEIGAAAADDAVLASSSSGIRASDFQAAAGDRQARVLIGHPFNPPHLIPLVEVVGGAATDPDAVADALALYTAAGKRPVRLHRELPGHVVNRLQAALWREAYALVDSGAISVRDLDAAMEAGPGLRWALEGPFMTQHLSGGPGGIAHILEHLGPPTAEWWRDLSSVGELSEHMVAAIVDGMDDEVAGRDVAAIRARRDELLVALLRLKSEGPRP
ncbi:3-hydroxyacyl-CoA dehydrogenase NAD-binding domain-containing protein [Cumulibacter manganitolerans]|uniref:3-hydroxyacyl-CoA dehydrogenase NAD-binding domain-containing protein n=1 Tax=Cumulibacter manganitolerans TaxID=1884992 RepID=UPI001294F83D|nr:3-hydroxyacyl-CoA dehydrogenase NAD-binding domain-containing protein [Cumulibacter manganitolerans]